MVTYAGMLGFSYCPKFIAEHYLTMTHISLCYGRLSRMDYGVQHHFQRYFSYIVAVSFIGWGNRSTRRKPSTCRFTDKRY